MDERLASQPDPYHELAAIYQSAGQDAWSRQLAQIVLQTAPDARTILDAGCGTGSAAIDFARAGLSVVALDRSAAMLRIAEQRLHDTGSSGCCRLADLREEHGFQGTFEAIHSAGIVNEQRTAGDLARIFSGFAQALRSRGWIIFDTHMPARYPRGREQVRVLSDTPDCLLYEAWQTSSGSVQIRWHWFLRALTGWQRHEATRGLRLWRRHEIESALAAAGVTVIRRQRYQEQGRVVWIAQKTR